MPTIAEIRQQYPQYQDLNDQQLAEGLHKKFYNDMPFEEFSGKIGIEAKPTQPSSITDTVKSVGSNVIGGGIDVAMTLPNLINQLAAGPQLLGRGIAENVDKLIGVDPQPRGELWQPFYGSYDAEKALGTEYEPQTTAGKVASFPARIAGGIIGAKGIQRGAVGIEKVLKETSSGSQLPAEASAGDFRAKAGDAYQKMRDEGATLNRGGINKVTYSIGKELDKTGLMNERLHGDTMSVVADLNKDAATGQMDLEKLDQYRQLLNQVVKSNTTKLEGMNPDAQKAQTAINALDDAVESIGAQHLSNGTQKAVESLNEGRKFYSTSARLKTVENIVENAAMTDNPQTAIKSGFRNLAKTLRNNPRGWSPEEIKAVNHAARTGILTGGLKLMGNRMISSATGTIAGAIGGGPLGAGLGMIGGAAAGLPFREAATALQKVRANNVTNTIIGRTLNPPAALTPVSFPSLAAPVGVSLLESEGARANRLALPLEDVRQRLQSLR
jgi:hypothetical protein